MIIIMYINFLIHILFLTHTTYCWSLIPHTYTHTIYCWSLLPDWWYETICEVICPSLNATESKDWQEFLMEELLYYKKIKIMDFSSPACQSWRSDGNSLLTPLKMSFKTMLLCLDESGICYTNTTHNQFFGFKTSCVCYLLV